MKRYTVQLTQSEITHLLTLIDRNKDTQEYYAPAFQYWIRSRKIEEKLKNASLNRRKS